MLQNILDSVAGIHKRITEEIGLVRLDIKKLDIKFDNVEKRLTARIDRLGLDLANLKDDAPTREEFDGLSDRIIKVEKKLD